MLSKTQGATSSTAAVTLAATGPGCQCVAVVGDKLEQIFSLGPGFKPIRATVPLPPGGYAITALCADGPSAVCADGTHWYWQRADSRWTRIANVLEAGE